MKKLVTAIFILFTCNISYPQDFPTNSNGEIEFSEVVEVSLPQNLLFANAKEWVAKTFGDYKSVIQFEDNNDCKLIIKGISDINYSVNIAGFSQVRQVNYTLTIECKTEKYRFKISNITETQIITLFGSVTKMPPLPIKALGDMSQEIAKLEELRRVDTSQMKKKALNIHNEEISRLAKSIREEKEFYKAEYEAIISLIKSLKGSMQKSDNW